MDIDTTPMGGVWRIGAVECELMTWSIHNPLEIRKKMIELEKKGKHYKFDYELVEGVLVARIKWFENGPQILMCPLGKQVIRSYFRKDGDTYIVNIFVDENGVPQYAGLPTDHYANQRMIPDLMRGYATYRSIRERWENDVPRGK